MGILKCVGFGLTLVVAWSLMGFAQSSVTMTVCNSGCDFSVIQEAVDAANDGGIIEVQAGTYRENLVIDGRNDLTIQGAEGELVTLDGSLGVADQLPGLFIQNSHNIAVRNLLIVNSRRAIHTETVTGLLIEQVRFRDNIRQTMLMGNTNGVIQQIVVESSLADQDGVHGQALNLWQGASEVILKDSQIMQSVFALLLQGDAQLTIENVTLSDNIFSHLFVRDQATARITGSTLTNAMMDANGNGGNGIDILEDGKLILDQSTVSDNQLRGISLSDQAQATISNSTIERNHSSNVIAFGQSTATITATQILDVQLDLEQNLFARGISVFDAAQITLEDSRINQSAELGAIVGGTGQLTLNNSTVSNSGSVGIWAFEQAVITLNDSTVSNNNDLGLNLLDQTQTTINNSLISNNREHNVLIAMDAVAQIAESQIQRARPLPSEQIARGIAVTGNGMLMMEGSTVADNQEIGIGLFESGQAIIDNSSIEDNLFHGIGAFGASGLTLTNSAVSRNRVVGIVIGGTVHATLDNNDIISNLEAGIWLQDQSMTVISSNTISSNTGHGMVINGEITSDINENRIVNNQICGIALVFEGGVPEDEIHITGQGNTIEDNGGSRPICGNVRLFPRDFGGGR